jgi:hypothetical protein
LSVTILGQCGMLYGCWPLKAVFFTADKRKCSRNCRTKCDKSKARTHHRI